MNTELHCSGCGKLIHAPRDAAGQRVRCPACGRELYVPTPADELEELPLTPEDTTLLQHEAALQAERLRLDQILRRESSPDDASATRRPAPATQRAGDIRETVVDYLRALVRSDLAGAEQSLAVLQRQKTEVLAILDRLAADQMPPAALGNIPPGVYLGFLKHLRSQL